MNEQNNENLPVKQNEQQILADKLDQIIELLEGQYKLSEKTLAKSFLHGVLVALGASVGITIVFAVLGWALSVLGAFPLVGEWFISLGNYLHR
jgi:hypothetical protein